MLSIIYLEHFCDGINIGVEKMKKVLSCIPAKLSFIEGNMNYLENQNVKLMQENDHLKARVASLQLHLNNSESRIKELEEDNYCFEIKLYQSQKMNTQVILATTFNS